MFVDFMDQGVHYFDINLTLSNPRYLELFLEYEDC